MRFGSQSCEELEPISSYHKPQFKPFHIVSLQSNLRGQTLGTFTHAFLFLELINPVFALTPCIALQSTHKTPCIPYNRDNFHGQITRKII